MVGARDRVLDGTSVQSSGVGIVWVMDVSWSSDDKLWGMLSPNISFPDCSYPLPGLTFLKSNLLAIFSNSFGIPSALLSSIRTCPSYIATTFFLFSFFLSLINMVLACSLMLIAAAEVMFFSPIKIPSPHGLMLNLKELSVSKRSCYLF